MKWAIGLSVLLAGGLALGSWWRRQKATHVSSQWLQERVRESSRVQFDGVTWRFPVNKAVNELGTWNAAKLRKRA